MVTASPNLHDPTHDPALFSPDEAATDEPPASERRQASRVVPETVFWKSLVSGALQLVDAICDDSCCVAVACEQGPRASALSSLELILLCRVFQGEPQKNLAFEFGVSPATISQLLGHARLKLGLGQRVSSTPLPIVFSALRESGIIEIPFTHFARFQREGREHVEVGFSSLDPITLSELSHSERHVALLIARGATYQQIAERRCTSPRTVSNQIANFSRKLRVQGRFELIRCWAARQWGFRATAMAAR